MRARGSLVAAAAVVAVALSACTAGKRAPAPTSSSAGSPASQSASSGGSAGGETSPPNYRAELSRPPHFPSLRPGQACPTSPVTAVNTSGFGGFAAGSGPVRPLAVSADGQAHLISDTQEPGWLAVKSLWFSTPSYQGPFLVRIRRLDHAGPAGLLENPRLTSFYTPPGPTSNADGGYRTVPGATWVKRPGCIAWQVDGLTFSNIIIVRAVCRAPGCVTPSEPKSTKP